MIQVNFRDASIDKLKTDILVVPVQEKPLDEPQLRLLDRHLRGKLQQRISSANFTGAEGSTLSYPTSGLLAAGHLLLVGIGSLKSPEPHTWRKLGAQARKEAATIGAKDMAFYFAPNGDAEVVAEAMVEGMLLASYQFGKYRSKHKAFRELDHVTFFRPGFKRTAALQRAVQTAVASAPGVYLARDLINEPPSVANARYLGEQALRHCRGRGLTVEVWNKRKIVAMNLAGLLAVNRGSHEEPRFIRIHYKPTRTAKKKVALIGKGITFDSGGLSLKPSKSMETMKLDMSGAAAVIGAMSRLPHLGLDVEVTGYVPTTDNLPGHNAQKPGDIIRYMNGKTVEVLNTDAEGRLILADALALAARQKPDYMINLATLTGACMVALGTQVAGVFSNHQRLADELLRCGRATGESLWQLPLVKEYRDDIKSSVADMKNIGGGHGGAITAALILEEFVDGRPWAHLDIAGPAFAERDTALCPKGGTGFGVRTLLKFLSSL